MQKRTYFKFSGILLMLLATIVVSTVLFLPLLIDINSYKAEIIAALEENLHRNVSFKQGEFSMKIGPSFVFKGVTISEPDRKERFLSADKIVVRLALFPLLQKKVSLTAITITGAEVHLIRRVDGTFNVDDLIKPTQDDSSITLSKLKFSHSTLLWHDMKIAKDGFKATARDITLELHDLERGKKGKVSLSCEIPSSNGMATKLSLSGAITLPEAGKSTIDSEVKLNIDLKSFENDRFWLYFGKYIPFGATGGRLDWSSSLNGKLQNFSAKGSLRLAETSVVWPKVFHAPVNPRVAQLDYDLHRTQNGVDLKTLKFNVDGLKVKGSCNIRDLNTSDPRITASATSERFRLEDFHRFIPYGIIAKDAADYIEQHVTGGLFTLETGRLDGRISQILAMEKGTNYNILYIKGVVEKGIIRYGGGTPLFHNIKGGLELLGKDFILHKMSGAFGNSPFTLEGKITDYPLESPCQYPFSMDMTPRPSEVAWLARFVRGEKLQFGGDSHLYLKGNGFTSAFNLSGNWDLKQSTYSYPGAVKKNQGMNNTLQFSAILGAQETKIQNLSYSLAQFSLSGSGLFRYVGTPYLGYEIQTNSFMLNEALPIATAWQGYHPKGNVKAHIASSGNPEDFTAMQYRGTLNFNGFSLIPVERLKPLTGINGTVTFKGNSLETSSISARYGDSPISLKGVVKSLRQGEAELSFSSPQLFLRDVSLAPPQSKTSIKRLHGTISHLAGTTIIKGLSGVIQSSNFHLLGSYTDGSTPKAELELTSGNLNIDDLKELLTSSQQQVAGYIKDGQEKGSATAMELSLKLKAEKGNYGDLPFSRLTAAMTRNNGIFYLREMGAELFGGTLSAKGRIDPGGEGSRYDLSFEAHKVDAEKLLQTLNITKEVRGTLQFSGNITARGKNLTDIKKTALGNIRLQLDEGSLKRFNVLSKVFSILNVSQLIRFQLPDMVANGMPYNQIKGSFAVSDGTVSTKDLFINSDAINMSVLGKADIVKETLAFTIGVQPLQTVDKLINRIPVVGWILKGKDKDFVTVYFEANGPWNNPVVSAIPVKSMSKGLLNIFRRVFELPVRLFTDTGEVLLGQ